jgi:hypothetical protein
MEHHGGNHPNDVVAPEGTPDVGEVMATAEGGERAQPSTSGPTETTTTMRQIVERLEVLDGNKVGKIGRLEQTVTWKLKLKLFTTRPGKLDRLLSHGPLYFAIHDLLASWARVSPTTYISYRHTYLQCVSTFLGSYITVSNRSNCHCPPT